MSQMINLKACKVFLKCVCVFFCGAFVRKTPAVAMSNGERDSWLLAPRRHEEMAVRMALARASHHAVQRHHMRSSVINVRKP